MARFIRPWYRDFDGVLKRLPTFGQRRDVIDTSSFPLGFPNRDQLPVDLDVRAELPQSLAKGGINCRVLVASPARVIRVFRIQFSGGHDRGPVFVRVVEVTLVQPIKPELTDRFQAADDLVKQSFRPGRATEINPGDVELLQIMEHCFGPAMLHLLVNFLEIFVILFVLVAHIQNEKPSLFKPSGDHPGVVRRDY